jgi:OmpA-OmpF porin, OOP family
MKNLILLTLLLLLVSSAQAQNGTTGRAKQRAKDNAQNRVDNKIDDKVNKGLDKVEEGIDNLFKRKKKKDQPNAEPGDQNSDDQGQDNGGNSAGNGSGNAQGGGAGRPAGGGSSSPASIKSYSKFDFVPGEKVLYFDNFERVAVGDFPVDFNTNASGEVITIDSKESKWLSMTKNGAFIPESVKQLPENFTMEFEVGINTDPTNNLSGLGLNFTTIKDDLMLESFFSKGTSIIYLHPGAGEASVSIIPTQGTEISNSVKMPQWDVDSQNNFAKVSVWRQKGRLRVYVNEHKLLDIPRFFSETAPYNFAFFRSFFQDCEAYLTNLRYAVGAPDTRSKLISEGKLVTRGITFDVGSDKIRPESYAVLKEIATVLNENPTVRVKVVGHTDADGSAASNLDLSKRRAAAVKATLATEFGVAATRLETDGKGATEPSEPNTTPQGKANNRRVEFIKM